MQTGTLRAHLHPRSTAERGRAAVILTIASLLISSAASADQTGGATLEIAVPQLIHQPVLLFLEAENRLADNTLHQDAAQARISSVMLEFDPPLQVLPVGATVEVVNKDPVLHNTHVFDRNRTLFNVATPTTSIAVQRKLTRPGLFGVRCDLHPSMNAWIAVVSNPYYAIVEKSGTFRIKDIEPGQYELHIQRPDSRDQVLVLELAPSEQRKIQLSP